MTQSEGIPGVSENPVKERILVCVGSSPSSAGLIHAAHRLAESLEASWMAVTVDAPDAYVMSGKDRQRLLAHLRLADSLGAQTIRLVGLRVSHEIVACARQYGITRILVGKPTLKRWRDRFQTSLVDDLIRHSGEIDVHCIAGGVVPAPVTLPIASRLPVVGRGYLISLVAVLIATLLAFWGRPFLRAPDLVMLYLFPIMVVAFRFGQGPSLLASALSVVAYNYFFVYPLFVFSLADPQILLTITILFTVGLVISHLMNRIRRQEQESRERERQTDSLHRLTREIMTTLNDEEIAGIITRHAFCLFGGEAVICLEDGAGGLKSVGATPDAFQPDTQTLEMIRWSIGHGKAAGRGTVNLSQGELTILPVGTSRTFGVLAMRITDPGFLQADHSFFLEAFAYQVSLAIERAKLGEELRATAIRIKSEELRSSLLSMASHDLRTPLAAIIGAGTALRDDRNTLDDFQQQELLETICIEAERMERLIANLLDMVRLESGGCQLRREWVPFEELVGTALVRLEKRCLGRRVVVKVEEKCPMLYVDPVFFAQVLVNLLDNAIKYTPVGGEIVWSVHHQGEQVVLVIQDQGPGIPPGLEEKIFEKFVRGRAEHIPGSGLGLAICRGVVQAHHGSIGVVNRETGGAEFHIVLPHPPLPPDLLQSVEHETGDRMT